MIVLRMESQRRKVKRHKCIKTIIKNITPLNKLHEHTPNHTHHEGYTNMLLKGGR